MSIQVICPTCEHIHTVKDESAGKKLRCKGCQAVIPIPAASAPEEADPWETGELAEPDEREAPMAPRQRKKAIAKPERAGRSSSAGMPTTIIVSLAINGLMIPINLLLIVVGMMTGELRGTAGAVIPLIVEITIIKGLLDQRNRIRLNSILLDGLGLALIFLCLVPVVFFLPTQPGKQNDVLAGGMVVWVVIAVKVVIWITDIVVLVSRSVREWCQR